jgi:hypothetical protein
MDWSFFMGLNKMFMECAVAFDIGNCLPDACGDIGRWALSSFALFYRTGDLRSD